jgi:hypothetical protein
MSIDLTLAAPVTADLLVAVAGYELGTGRSVPSVAAVAGLAGAVIGGFALVRAARPAGGGRRVGAVSALVLGLVGVVVGGLHGVNGAGGLGTGNGLAGAVLAVVLGIIGAALGGVALARSGRRDSRAA